MYVFICYIYRLKIYISLKGMICRIYLVKRHLDTHEMWKDFSDKTYVGNVMNSRNSVLTEMGQLERWLISKLLLEGLALREIIVSETSQILQIYLLFKNRSAEKRLHVFAQLSEVERRRE